MWDHLTNSSSLEVFKEDLSARSHSSQQGWWSWKSSVQLLPLRLLSESFPPLWVALKMNLKRYKISQKYSWTLPPSLCLVLLRTLVWWLLSWDIAHSKEPWYWRDTGHNDSKMYFKWKLLVLISCRWCSSCHQSGMLTLTQSTDYPHV